jgi:hypothetical protein
MSDDLLELSMWRDGKIMHGNCLGDIKKLEAERDEARRMYCEKVSNASRQYGTSAKDVAKQLKWNCFKDDTLSQEVSQPRGA